MATLFEAVLKRMTEVALSLSHRLGTVLSVCHIEDARKLGWSLTSIAGACTAIILPTPLISKGERFVYDRSHQK